MTTIDVGLARLRSAAHHVRTAAHYGWAVWDTVAIWLKGTIVLF